MSLHAKVFLRRDAFTLDAQMELPANSGITAVFGRSGSGKTTLLRWIAGLDRALSGFLEVNGQVWEDSDRNLFVPPHRRSIGYVFQEAGLFAHLSIEANLQYGLRRLPLRPRPERFDHWVDLLGVREFLKRFPRELSGGERQRVAMARSLLLEPKLLLLDEPMSALDSVSKTEIFPYLEAVKSELKIPVLYVSHSEGEVRRLADSVLPVELGRVRPQVPVLEFFSPQARQMFLPPAISFVGDSGSGKTTLIEALLPRLIARGYRVGAIKHDAHRFQIDHAGKDSYRFSHAGAEAMVISSANQLALVKKTSASTPIEEILRAYFSDFDLVLTEGYRKSLLPKIRVLCGANSNPCPKPDSEMAGPVVAWVTDVPEQIQALSQASRVDGTPRQDTLVFGLNDWDTIANWIEKNLIPEQKRRSLP